ncbi:YtxH domain-containing protein [Actinomadura gamaensis]|uniref:YtxH domain-containing protein n=1 Tax=Actinomadura gamaensis TaxID=1763541 RepID=A0ABV9TSS7_9ACTN
MRYRVAFAVGAAVGYVLGAKAGRERYEQIRRTSQRVAGTPAVQNAAGVVRERASGARERVVAAARERGGTIGRVAGGDDAGGPQGDPLRDAVVEDAAGRRSADF